MDYAKVSESIAETISMATKPLTEAQKVLMSGALAVWIEKAVADEREACARACEAQAEVPECPERAQYCADAIRMRSN